MKQMWVVACLLVCPLLICSCAPLSSGAKYTFARIAPDQTLAPVKGPIGASESASAMPIAENVSIILNGGYLRYLTAIGRPEVVIFAKVRVREPDEPNESLVWENIYLLTEDASNQMVINKDSFLPRLDIPILPGIKYDQQEVYVSLRIVELDQGDNERVKALIGSAAAAGAVFRPDAAVGISVVQAIMNYVTASNSDDIEFQFDFAIVPNDQKVHDTSAWREEGETDLVLQPRVGKYVLVKTEHRMRENLPSNTLEMIPLSARYLMGMTLRFATLGVCNWRVWEAFGTDREDDFYQQIVGRPFQIEYEAWQRPEFVNGQLVFPGIGGTVYLVNDHLAYREGVVPRTFIDQGYLVLSIVESESGLDLEQVQAATKMKQAVDELVKTNQVTKEELQEVLSTEVGRIKNAYDREQARLEYRERLKLATSNEALQGAYDAYVEDLKETGLEGPELRRALDSAKKRAGRIARSNEWHGLSAQRLDRKVLFLNAGAVNTSLVIIHAPGDELEVRSNPVGIEVATGKAGQLTSLPSQGYELTFKTPADVTRHSLTVHANGIPKTFDFWLVPHSVLKPKKILKGGNEQAFGADTRWTAESSLIFESDVEINGKGLWEFLSELYLDGDRIEFQVEGQRLVVPNATGEEKKPDKLRFGPVSRLETVTRKRAIV